MLDATWVRPLIWIDYRLAIILMVSTPLVLLIWAFIKQADAIQHLLVIYWRVASLLMISVYLMIPSWSIGFFSSFIAQILIPVSLWFWADLNDEINDQPQRLLRLTLTAWRWAVTLFCTVGAIILIPFLDCAVAEDLPQQELCRLWLEPAWGYKGLFHQASDPGFLGFMGMLGLAIYVCYFAYFCVFRLGKQGRSAMEK